MKYKYIFLPFLALLIAFCSPSQKSVSKMTSDPIDLKVEALLKQMTLEEKIGQLTLFTTDWGATGPTIREGYTNDIRKGACGALFNSHTAAFTRELQRIAVEETRLKIPLIFGYDVIHGYKTIFPIPLAEACSWDMEAVEKSARVSATEAAAAGLQWTFAPMVDVARDPRWGRVMEGAGEDPFLGSRIAEARVHGFQGKGLGQTDAVMACVKHFAAYGAPIAGRDYNTVDMSERYFREFYLPPYAAAVKAGAATVMSSFNDYDGIPATGNKFLMTNVLRDEWGFRGFVVTDYTSINEMVSHGVVADEKAAGELAINAGIDMDMQGAVYQRFLAQSIQENKVSIEQVDASVRRILRLKFQLGLFDDPYKFCNEQREKDLILCKPHRDAARDVARKSVVLLKNNNHVLPLAKSGKIALIGPLADNKSELLGSWSGSGDFNDCISLLQGLKEVYKGDVYYAKGCEIEGADKSGFAVALDAARRSDVVVVAVGETAQMSGEASCRTNIHLPGVQAELIEALKQTGKPIVVVLMNGRPLAIPEVEAQADAIVEAWWLGTETGHALADVLMGDFNPSGKLCMSFPRSEGQIPVFYNEKSTGRPFDPNSKWTSKYLDSPNAPLYPFGFGLSYAQFEYGKPSLSQSAMGAADAIVLTVEVRNTGKADGTETVQLYTRDLVASVTRPVKELKGFQKVFIPAGQSKTVQFTIREPDLRFYRKDMQFASESGLFTLMVGGDSQNLQSVNMELK